ncbi:MAG: hypothetical protein ACLQMO_02125 [Acidobacteriaceae bacterium]
MTRKIQIAALLLAALAMLGSTGCRNGYYHHHDHDQDHQHYQDHDHDHSPPPLHRDQ